jgi:hypothetical protein
MRWMTRLLLPAFAMLLASFPLAAAAELHKGENFDVPIPEGYKLSKGNESQRHFLAHYIPQDQTEENWTQKIIVQIFRGQHMDAPDYINLVKGRPSADGCMSFSTQDLVNDIHNGYRSSRITMTCTLGTDSGMGSVSMLRVYSGDENFYYVQRAWRGAPFQGPNLPLSRKELTDWAAFLDAVLVCNTDGPDHPCGS